MSDDKYDFCYFCDKIIRDGDPCYDPWKDEVILCPICYGKYMKLRKKVVEISHKSIDDVALDYVRATIKDLERG